LRSPPGGGAVGRIAPVAAAEAIGGVVTAQIHATVQCRRDPNRHFRVGPFTPAGYSILAWENGAE
jgi:hypothetical protein